MRHMIVLDPCVPAVPIGSEPTPGLGGMQGKVVGFIDNTKPNFDLLAAAMGDLLVREHGARAFVTHRKRAASSGADGAQLDALRDQCDVVIAGSGD